MFHLTPIALVQALAYQRRLSVWTVSGQVMVLANGPATATIIVALNEGL